MFIANLLLMFMYVLLGFMVTYALAMGIPYCINLIHDELVTFRLRRQQGEDKAIDEEALVIFFEELYSWAKENSNLISVR